MQLDTFNRPKNNNLSEVVDESDSGVALQRVGDSVNIDFSFVEQMVEHVVCVVR